MLRLLLPLFARRLGTGKAIYVDVNVREWLVEFGLRLDDEFVLFWVISKQTADTFHLLGRVTTKAKRVLVPPPLLIQHHILDLRAVNTSQVQPFVLRLVIRKRGVTAAGDGGLMPLLLLLQLCPQVGDGEI